MVIKLIKINSLLYYRATTRDGVIGGLGGFGGLFRIKNITKKYREPVLVMAADGVGTKLKIAQDISRHGTVGIDLVAMCVNDILCNGAEPLTFLDYYACGSLDVHVAHNVLFGIMNGCQEANCALLGNIYITTNFEIWCLYVILISL